MKKIIIVFGLIVGILGLTSQGRAEPICSPNKQGGVDCWAPGGGSYTTQGKGNKTNVAPWREIQDNRQVSNDHCDNACKWHEVCVCEPDSEDEVCVYECESVLKDGGDSSESTETGALN